MFTPHQVSHVGCHVSHVRCQVSGIRCQVSRVTCQIIYIYIYIFFFFFTNWWSLLAEGLFSTGPTPSIFFYLQIFFITIYLILDAGYFCLHALEKRFYKLLEHLIMYPETFYTLTLNTNYTYPKVFIMHTK